jgi:hypothetical protein
MAEEHGPDEVRASYEATMGKELGQMFYLLWNECAWLHLKWNDYEILFGSKPERVDLLNRAAPAFFKSIQDVLWEDILMHLCRITDPPKSCGKHTLTLQALPTLVPQAIRPDVRSRLQEASRKSEFARNWRNRHIAHRDLSHALNKHAVPLAHASRKGVKEALKAIVDLLNYVEEQQCGSSTMYDYGISPPGNAESLLYVLRDGVKARVDRGERLKSGNPLSNDLHPQTAI